MEPDEKLPAGDPGTIHIEFSVAKDVLTEKRLEILQVLSRGDFESVTELVEALGRDKKNVSRDLKKLYEHGLVELEEGGRSKSPSFDFSAIRIKPIEFEENAEEEVPETYDTDLEEPALAASDHEPGYSAEDE